MIQTDHEYWIAYTANRIYCAATKVYSLRELEQELWPLMQGPIYVPLEVFRIAARSVLLEMSERKKSQVLDNVECAALLSQARSSVPS